MSNVMHKKREWEFFFFTSNALKCTKKQHQKVLALNKFLNTPLPSRTCVEASELVEEEEGEENQIFYAIDFRMGIFSFYFGSVAA